MAKEIKEKLKIIIQNCINYPSFVLTKTIYQLIFKNNLNALALKILALIPARYDSTRFPGKPLVDIGGKSMIERVFLQTKLALDSVYVATDDQRINDAVKKFGGKSVMTAKEHQSGTDRCKEALLKIEEIEGVKFDYIINVQGDEPFISPTQIKLLISTFNNGATELATLIKQAEKTEDILNPNKPKVVINNAMEALLFSRSPIPFCRGTEQSDWISKGNYYNHIGMYGYRRDVLLKITTLPQSFLEKMESLEQLRWLENGYKINTAITTEESVSIDTPEDLQNLLKNMNQYTNKI